jgi:plasmid stabilization system protein ParE
VRRLVYLASARRDLASILDYITRQSGSLAVGRGFTDQLRGHCAKLARLPGTLGRARPELRPDIRSTVHRGYVIFFRYRDDTLEIVSILEGHRDIDGHFGAEVPDDRD